LKQIRQLLSPRVDQPAHQHDSAIIDDDEKNSRCENKKFSKSVLLNPAKSLEHIRTVTNGHSEIQLNLRTSHENVNVETQNVAIKQSVLHLHNLASQSSR
jgi:hypothetical protein